jgi:hypothetical protein
VLAFGAKYALQATIEIAAQREMVNGCAGRKTAKKNLKVLLIGMALNLILNNAI